jgi:hypothetical protein
MVGVIYYYAAAKRHPEPILPPAETGAFVIPRESLPRRDRRTVRSLTSQYRTSTTASPFA